MLPNWYFSCGIVRKKGNTGVVLIERINYLQIKFYGIDGPFPIKEEHSYKMVNFKKISYS